MNITKREKILLQMLLGVLVIGLLFVYLLLPKMKEHKELVATKATDEQTLEDMNNSLLNMNVFEEKQDSLERIEKINIFFNGIWNSYTMDGFVNKLVADNHLDITSLSIGTFSTISDKAFDVIIEKGEEEEAEDDEDNEKDLLLACDVSLAATGKYDDMLALIDALNGESKTIEITSCAISKNFFRDYDEEEQNTIYGNLSMTFRIYGILPFEEGGKQNDEQ
ncbi:MAG: hypothetical protein MJ105_01915 [Lachnospiraceae bacterium]|nr:hypothetical protein [Lachnospiraceae bacterium]